MIFIIYPVISLCDICPRPNKGQSFRQRINIAIGSINTFDLTCKPIIWNAATFMQVIKNHLKQSGVFAMRNAAKVGDPTHIPQQVNRFAIRGACADFGRICQCFQCDQVICITRFDQFFAFWRKFQRIYQRVNRAKLQIAVAPDQFFQGRKPVIHDRLRHGIIQWRRLARDAKRPVRHPPPSASRNLGQFIRGQFTHSTPIKFGE